VESNKPIHICLVRYPNRKFFIHPSNNTKHCITLSFSDKGSPLRLKHYRSQNNYSIVNNHDVIQIVLENPTRYIMCKQLKDLLISKSLKDIDVGSVKLINECYFSKDNYRIDYQTIQDNVNGDEPDTERLSGSYWRVCLQESMTCQPVKYGMSVRFKCLITGLYLTHINESEF
jgi:hypothetical protein